MVAEYNALRAEVLSANQNMHHTLSWGIRAGILLLSIGLGSVALPGLEVARVVYFLLLVPAFAIAGFLFWFGELCRQQRAASYLSELEREVNRAELSTHGTICMQWHHSWLETRSTNPLQVYFFDHYRNFALSWLTMSAVSSAIAFWMIAFLDADPRVVGLLALLCPLPVAIQILIMNSQAQRYFSYPFVKRLLGLPWLPGVLVAARTCGLVLLILVGSQVTHLDRFWIVYVGVLIVAADIADGWLVRRFTPTLSARFEILDGCVDFAGVIGVSAAILATQEPGWVSAAMILILVRQGVRAATWLATRTSTNEHRRGLRWSGKVFHLTAALCLVVALCDWSSTFVAISVCGLAALAVAWSVWECATDIITARSAR